jgi:adenine-specific DNA-methyltransferase
MPSLHWIGKEKVINHHLDVPYRVLEHQYTFEAVAPSSASVTDSTPMVEALIPMAEALEAGGNSGNKIIHGDNLEALKSLLPEYEGKIKCIYIDPPYNTGNEGWVYNDNVNDPKLKKWLGQVVGKEAEDLTRHDKWLCMMYPRLKLLHKLLAEDGAIFISIDDNEQASLKLLMDEIFGSGNFIGQFLWEKKNVVQNDAKFSSTNHEYVTTYRRSEKLILFNLLPRTEDANARYDNPDNDIRGSWTSVALTAKSGSESNLYDFTFSNGVHWKPNQGAYPRLSKESLAKAYEENRLWFGKTGKNVPRLKKYLNEVKQGMVSNSILYNDNVGSTQYAKEQLKKILNSNLFDTPKPSSLIEIFIKLSSNKNSIILDSFAGSGTTAHAVLNLNKQDGGNRQFICIEMEEYAQTITAERVKRVINGYGDKEGTGGSFDYYELGPALFNDDNEINELVGVEKLRQYIYYTETKCTLNSPFKGGARRAGDVKDNNYLLNKHNDTAYYFYYEQDSVTTLNYEFLSTIKTKAEQYVIYADNCLLTKEFMTKHHIIFKKIPRDITKF